MIIRENIPLAPLTTLGVGGPARYFVEVGDEREVGEAVEFARACQLPLFVLGGGSNVLVADAGFPGLVVKVGMSDVQRLPAVQGRMSFTVAAGADWDTFVWLTVESECAGLECLSGIPGTVGGTPVQNVGAYGQEVAETIRKVRVLDLQSLEICDLTHAECGFSYRSSIFNGSAAGRYIILRVSFALQLPGRANIAYPDLHTYFAKRVSLPTVAEVRTAVREIRHSKGMLLVPGDGECHSAGSFFKNPVVSHDCFTTLAALAEQRGDYLTGYPAAHGCRKLPAAWLVEQAGFSKGYARGAAAISGRHALAIVNRGGATAADILALAREIQAGVKREFGIELQPEPVFVGFEPQC